MKERNILRYASAGASALVFVVYMLTLSHSVGFIDSGELATVAHTFGIAHPTGYPLYTIVAGLWAQLPFGDGIFRLNMFSALLCALGVGMFVHLIFTMLGIAEKRRTRSQGKNKKKAGTDKPAEISFGVRLVASVFGALVIGFSETYWSTALSNEVYPLHLLFIPIILYFFVKSVFVDEQGSVAEKRHWMLFALVLGLSFTNHMTTILFAPAFLILFFWRYGFNAASGRKVLLAIPAFIVGLLPYAYLPLRAASQPFMNWGNPQNWENFFRHVSGAQYSVWMFSGESASRQFNYFWSSFPMEFAVVLLFFIGIGLVFTYMRHRKIGAMLVVLFVTCLFYSMNYDIYDIDSYFLLAYVVAGIWAAYGLVFVAQRWMKADVRMAAGAAAVGIGILIGVHWSAVDESGSYMVEDYTKNVFQSVEKNAVVLSYQWDYWVSASMYYQQVEGLRKDIIVLDKELFRRSWYLTHIETYYPEIYTASKKEFEVFRTELLKFERDIPYDPRIIDGAYHALINSIIDHAYTNRPVYVTIEIEKEFGTGYERIPEGLAFRLYRTADIPSLDTPVWDDFKVHSLDRSGRLENAMKDFYANMLLNRSMLYIREQRFDDAERYITRASTFSPDNPNVREWMARIRQAKSMSAVYR